ncbi:hypothetical protein [Nostoc sp. 'Peltigera membranacea cyanobiont' 232]|nr:hypothetical protein [Nostoc sp. 'Peltigera membranacea cyanobiont' 232]
MNKTTPHEWRCDSSLTPHSLKTVGRIALDTIRDGGILCHRFGYCVR